MSWDTNGSLIGAVRLDTARAYADVPGLLERTIQQDDSAAWALLKQRIDYVYEHLGYALAPVLNKDCLLYTSPSPRDRTRSRMPSSA